MNSRLHKFPWMPLLLVVAVVLAAGAIWATIRGDSGGSSPSGNISGSAIGGPFTLVDETGRTVTQDSYAGKWRLMYFGFTYCPDVCPTDTAAMAAGLKAFEAKYPARGAKVQPLFISFDPERDTPQALAEFTDNFHPRLIGLTGSREQVDSVLKAYRIYAQKVPGASPDSYVYDHVALVYLMDPDGKPVQALTGPTAESVAAMLEKYVS